MKKLGTLICLCMLCTGLYSQTQTDLGYYISKKGKVFYARFLHTNDMDRSKEIIIFQRDDNNINLHPEDILGYGFENGVKYISAQVTINNREQESIFLEELIEEDSLTLYSGYIQNKEEFFVRIGDNPMKHIRDNGLEYREYLESLAVNCQKKEDIDKQPMILSAYSLMRMHKAYTTCNTHLFQRFRFGLVGGIAGTMYHPKFDEDGYDYTVSPGFRLGIFCQIPMNDKFSFQPELALSYVKIEGKTKQIRQSPVRTYKRTSLQLPLLFKYTMNQLNGKIIPFLEFGPSLDFRLTGNAFPFLYETIYIEKTYIKHKVSPILYGASLGAGVEFKKSPKYSILMGLRYTGCAGNTNFDEKEIHNILSLNVSFIL